MVSKFLSNFRTATILLLTPLLFSPLLLSEKSVSPFLKHILIKICRRSNAYIVS